MAISTITTPRRMSTEAIRAGDKTTRPIPSEVVVVIDQTMYRNRPAINPKYASGAPADVSGRIVAEGGGPR